MHGSFHGNVTHAHFSPHVSCVCFPPRILVRQIDVQVMMSKQALWQMKTSINLLGTSLFDGEREGGRHVFLIRTYVNGRGIVREYTLQYIYPSVSHGKHLPAAEIARHIIPQIFL